MISASVAPTRHLAALWIADLVGYSRLAATDEDAALRLVALFQRSACREIDGHAGRLVNVTGDAVLAEFTSTDAAVRAALMLKNGFAEEACAAGLPGVLRIGVHVADITLASDSKLYGDGVNLAARLQTEAQPGQVLVSESVWQQLHSRRHFRFEALGERTLKGQEHPLQIFSVALPKEDDATAGASAHGGAGAAWSALVQRLQKRMLVHWGFTYLAGAWALLQLLALLAATFAWPQLVQQAATLLFVIGFLVALVLAWYHGETSRRHVCGMELLLLTGLLGVAGGVIWLVGGSRSPATTAEAGVASLHVPAAATETKTIAVLPFQNLSSDPENEYFSDGITEQLLDALAKVEGLRVPARTSSFAFKNKNADVREIGEKLGVRTVLEGSVRKSGDQLRIRVQLSDASSGYNLWSETYDRRHADALALQEEIATAVVRALQLRLPGRETAPVREQTRDPEAHKLYLKGLYVWNKWTREGQEQALKFFGEAIERDPTYAKAYAGLANTYTMLVISGHAPGAEASARAKAAAEKALELDETLAEAHVSRATILMSEGDFPGAERSFRRAIELNASYATARQGYAMLLVMRGRMNEAVREIHQAQELDPLSPPINLSYALLFYLSRDYGSAIEQSSRTLDLEPNFAWALDIAGLAHVLEGRHDQGVRLLEQALKLAPEDPELLADLATVHARGRHAEEARALVKRLENAPQPERNAFRIAQIYAALDEKDNAFQWLERTHWDVLSLMLLRAEPFLDPLRSDPRYMQLLTRLGLA